VLSFQLEPVLSRATWSRARALMCPHVAGWHAGTAFKKIGRLGNLGRAARVSGGDGASHGTEADEAGGPQSCESAPTASLCLRPSCPRQRRGPRCHARGRLAGAASYLLRARRPSSLPGAGMRPARTAGMAFLQPDPLQLSNKDAVHPNHHIRAGRRGPRSGPQAQGRLPAARVAGDDGAERIARRRRRQATTVPRGRGAAGTPEPRLAVAVRLLRAPAFSFSLSLCSGATAATKQDEPEPKRVPPGGAKQAVRLSSA
jgi:hypothetical protein